MKALNCKSVALLLVLAISTSSAWAKEVKKTLKQEYKTSGSTVLEMDIKFSQLNIETWNQPLASFEVTISVDNVDESKAKKMLELMDVEFKQSGNTIFVTTKIDENFNKGDWGKNKKFSFIIDAKIPASVGLVLDSNFGSTEISELTGNVKIESNYGSLAINSLTGNNIALDLNYGKTKLGTVAHASVEVNYGDLEVEKAQSLDLEVNFGSATIREISDLEAEVSFGDLIVKEVRADFKLISLSNNTGNVDVTVDRNAGFTLNADMKMGNITTPKLDQEVSETKGMAKSVSGKHGNGKSVIEAEGKLGNILISLK